MSSFVNIERKDKKNSKIPIPKDYFNGFLFFYSENPYFCKKIHGQRISAKFEG